MIKIIGKAGAGIAAAVLLLGSGVVFADAHHGGDHHSEHIGNVVRGTYESGQVAATLTQGSISIKTKSGQTLSITVTPKTHLEIEASGTVQNLSTAIQNGKLDITARVVNQNNTYVATAIVGHVNANPEHSEHSEHSKKSEHSDHSSKHHHGN